MLTTTLLPSRTKNKLFPNPQQTKVIPIRPKTEHLRRAVETESVPPREENQLLLERFRKEMKKEGYAELRDVSLRITDDGQEVELTGVVPSYHMKQIAQASIRRIDSAVRVSNHIVVHWPDHKNR